MIVAFAEIVAVVGPAVASLAVAVFVAGSSLQNRRRRWKERERVWGWARRRGWEQGRKRREQKWARELSLWP